MGAAASLGRRSNESAARIGAPMPLIEVFLYLQVLDLFTTLLGFRLGLSEASPFVRLLTLTGPIMGIVLCKTVAFSLGALCIATRRVRLIGWINYWYAGLAVWNLFAILRSVTVAA
jgi:uncharacterized protein DUF5658